MFCYTTEKIIESQEIHIAEVYLRKASFIFETNLAIVLLVYVIIVVLLLFQEKLWLVLGGEAAV